jgi:hypothetical protein
MERKREEGKNNDSERLTLSPHTLPKSPGIPSWVFSPCETQPQVQLCRVSFPGARALRTRGRVAAGRARQAERRLVMADMRSAVLDDTARSCGGGNILSATTQSEDVPRRQAVLSM